MKKENNIIKNAVSGINMTYSEKERLINACNQAQLKEKTPSHITNRRIAVVAVCFVLLLAMATVTIASREYLKTKVNNTPHIPEESIEKNDNSVICNSEGKGYYISCNGVAGDDEQVYLDITLNKKDNSAVFKTEEEVSVIRCNLWDAVLEFADGYQKKIYFLMLEDSTDSQYHLEGHILFYNDEKQYLGQDAELYIGGVSADLSDDSSVEICRFDDPLKVTVSVDSTVRTVEFDIGEFTILDSGIEIKSAEISASKVSLYGDCNITGPIYDLESVMDEAYLICGGEQIPLGSKTDAGTLPDGRFTIGWISKTVIDPEAITAIYIDGKTIELN